MGSHVDDYVYILGSRHYEPVNSEKRCLPRGHGWRWITSSLGLTNIGRFDEQSAAKAPDRAYEVLRNAG